MEFAMNAYNSALFLLKSYFTSLIYELKHIHWILARY